MWPVYSLLDIISESKVIFGIFLIRAYSILLFLFPFFIIFVIFMAFSYFFGFYLGFMFYFYFYLRGLRLESVFGVGVFFFDFGKINLPFF